MEENWNEGCMCDKNCVCREEAGMNDPVMFQFDDSFVYHHMASMLGRVTLKLSILPKKIK